ncbi:type IV pilin protein, partial [Enhygromyxa salina]|uniref:type IV pilin protein n=1 Tax=Enhygromyxa salina TaxID=215803 RepID=UPI0011B2797B
MVPNTYMPQGNPRGAADVCPRLKGFRILRNPFVVDGRSRRPRRGLQQAGFTLTEIMIVLAVITIVATIAFVGLRNNQWEGAYLRFTDDLV